MENIEIILICLSILVLIGLLILLFRKPENITNYFTDLKNDRSNLSQALNGLIIEHFSSNRLELAKNMDRVLDQLGVNLNSTKGAQDELVVKVNKRFDSFLANSNMQLQTIGKSQSNQLAIFQKELKGLTDSNESKFNSLRESLSKSMSDIRLDMNRKLESIQSDNSKQLEKMRETVDEKLHKTLEDRLGKSFELVSKQLSEVQKGLGEMQNLANGVGDLKRVLSNVKTRGVMGEIQLANILEQLLTPDQYSVNVATIPGSRCHVEFAIKLPGRDEDGSTIWLPIDSKFPMDRYEQLQDAYETGEKDDIHVAQKALFDTIKSMAKDIKEKYIAPPHTTDFGILFLPTEGLYADVVRNSELCHKLQQEYKIMLAGPTNLSALLNSLQMGFRSLAIEKRSSEVWKILRAVKSEFGEFGKVLNKVQKKLNEASNTIDKAGVRTRAIERNLREVEALPVGSDEVKELPFDDGIDLEDFMVIEDASN